MVICFNDIFSKNCCSRFLLTVKKVRFKNIIDFGGEMILMHLLSEIVY